MIQTRVLNALDPPPLARRDLSSPEKVQSFIQASVLDTLGGTVSSLPVESTRELVQRRPSGRNAADTDRTPDVHFSAPLINTSTIGLGISVVGGSGGSPRTSAIVRSPSPIGRLQQHQQQQQNDAIRSSDAVDCSPAIDQHAPTLSTPQLHFGRSNSATPSIRPTLPRPLDNSSRSQTPPPQLHRSVSAAASNASNIPSERAGANLVILSPFNTLPPPIAPLTRSGETPYDFIIRMKRTVSRKEWGLLLSKSDPFYDEARRLFIGAFDFRGLPVDLCLRKFLYHVGLPTESQQINRLLDSLGEHYEAQNPTIYPPGHKGMLQCAANDVAGLIFLHTFLYNSKSNMQPPTREEVAKMYNYPMMVMYENLMAAEMVTARDDVPALDGGSGHHALYSALPPPRRPPRSAASVNFALGFSKSDVYHMMEQGERATLKDELATPFACLGTFQGIPPLDFHPTPQENRVLSFMWKPEKLQRRSGLEATERSRSSVNVLVVKQGRIMFRSDCRTVRGGGGGGGGGSTAPDSPGPASPSLNGLGKSRTPVEWYMALTASGQLLVWKSTTWLSRRRSLASNSVGSASPTRSTGTASPSERTITSGIMSPTSSLSASPTGQLVSRDGFVAPQPAYVFSLDDVIALVDHANELTSCFHLILSSPLTTGKSGPSNGRPNSARPPTLERKSSSFLFNARSKHASGEYLLQCDTEHDMWDWVYHINTAATLRTVGFKTIAKDPVLAIQQRDFPEITDDTLESYAVKHPHVRSSSANSHSSASSAASVNSFRTQTINSISSASSTSSGRSLSNSVTRSLSRATAKFRPSSPHTNVSPSSPSTTSSASSTTKPPANRRRKSLLMSMLRLGNNPSVISEEPSPLRSSNHNILGSAMDEPDQKKLMEPVPVAPPVRRLHSAVEISRPSAPPHLTVAVHTERSASVDTMLERQHRPCIRAPPSDLSIDMNLVHAAATATVDTTVVRGRSRTRSRSRSASNPSSPPQPSLNMSRKTSPQSVSSDSPLSASPTQFHITTLDTAGGLSGSELMKEKLNRFKTQLNNAMATYREQVHLHAKYSILAPAYAKSRTKSIAIGHFIVDQLWRLSVVIEKVSAYIYVLEHEIGGDHAVSQLMCGSPLVASPTPQLAAGSPHMLTVPGSASPTQQSSFVDPAAPPLSRQPSTASAVSMRDPGGTLSPDPATQQQQIQSARNSKVMEDLAQLVI
ncbi:hypothetical protein RI367_006191 [Sorochytrium milnesiophthora]